MQKIMFLGNPQLQIPLPSEHRLSTRSVRKQQQLMDVLGSCLQWDPRKRPSLAALIAHPFLEDTVEGLCLADVQDLVDELMEGVSQAVGGPPVLRGGRGSEGGASPWQ